MIDLKKLTSRWWRNNARVLSEALSDEIFGSRGGEVVTLIRQEFEQKRQSNIEKHRRKFVKNATLKNMD